MRPRTSALDRPLAVFANRALVRTLSPVARRGVGFTTRGLQHVPPVGPVLIASNHAAFSDSAWIHLAVGRRLVVAGAKPRLFRNAPLRALMALGNVLRVDDHDAWLEDTRALLARGCCVLTYPELGRNPNGLGPFHPWAAELSIASGQPIVPAFVHGTTAGHEGPPWVAFGRPFTGDHAGSMTMRLREAIDALGRSA